MAQLQPYTIEKFLGVNKSATETLLQLGEASEMKNWIITDDYKIQKMYGYLSKIDLGPGNINGFTVLGDKLIVAHGTYLYEFDLSEVA
jgi:hypothetical protein